MSLRVQEAAERLAASSLDHGRHSFAWIKFAPLLLRERAELRITYPPHYRRASPEIYDATRNEYLERAHVRLPHSYHVF